MRTPGTTAHVAARDRCPWLRPASCGRDIALLPTNLPTPGP